MGKLKAIKEAVEAASRQLDMSTSARMARAADQGFDTPVFHYSRTGADIQAFEPSKLDLSPFGIGPHVGTLEAAQHRGSGWRNTGVMYPLRANQGRQFLAPDGKPWNEEKLSAALRAMQVEKFGEDFHDYAGARDWLANEMWAKYDSIPYINDVEDAGSVSYIMNPTALRSTNAAFDPANIGKPDIMGSIDPRLLAPVAAVGAGAGYAMNQYAPLPPLDPAYAEFARRREAKRDTWRQLKEGVFTLGSAMAGGIVGDLSRLGGYLNPFMSVEQTEQGAQGIENAMMYQPTGPNRYLEGLGNEIEQAQHDFAPLTDQIPNSIPGRAYNALPERAQGLIRIGADLAL